MIPKQMRELSPMRQDATITFVCDQLRTIPIFLIGK